MKTNKLMLAAMLFGAVALVSCDKEKENNDVVPPTPTPDPEVTVPDLDPTEGKITLAIHFVAAPCNDVILTGSFAEGAWDGTSLKMEAIKDFDGWYKAVITPAEANESGYTCEAKPVQLQSDGSFSWDGQWYGDGTNLVKILTVPVVSWTTTKATARANLSSWQMLQDKSLLQKPMAGK